MHEIVCSIIEGVCAIIAAISATMLGTSKLTNIINRNSYLINYAESSFKACEIMQKAKERIIIVVVYGDNFLMEYEEYLISYMKRGVKIEFLMLEANKAYNFVKSMKLNRNNNMKNASNKTNQRLRRLANYDLMEIRTTKEHITASYIAVDIDRKNEKRKKSAAIQMMVYQKGIESKELPIIYLNPKKNVKFFENTVKCIQSMWNNGTPWEVS